MDILQEKYEKLKAELQSYGSAAVAFSGGVDSTFLLKTAHDVLGEHTAAVTSKSRSFPGHELREALAFCETNGIRQFVCETDELEIPGFSENPPERCYLCKKELFTKMSMLVKKEGYSELAEGSNLDDDGDYRPGHRAILELGIKSPLRRAGLTKADIRELSRELGLPTWDKPSYACLSSRFPYGERITAEKLQMVEAAEQYLLERGFRQMRVRMHGGRMARIEVLPEEIERLVGMREELNAKFRKLGFLYVTADLAGFRSGSMNAVLTAEDKRR